jgi:ribose/xylose/arabinose/galactoside ABC-type transport system permease subunit
MKTTRERFRDVLIWAGGLFIISSTVIFLYNINSYWVPAGIGCILILAVVIYFVMKGFSDG